MNPALCSLVLLFATAQDPIVRGGDVEWRGVTAKAADGAVLELRGRGYLSLPGLGGDERADVDAAAAFVSRWIAEHPRATVTVVRSSDLLDTIVRWVWVEHDGICLNVELVRSGCYREGRMRVLPYEQLAVSPARRQAFAKALREASFAALTGRRGMWGRKGMEGPRLDELGDWHFDGEEFEKALSCYDGALALGHEGVLTHERRAQCLWRLGRMDEADLAAEAALVDLLHPDMHAFGLEEHLARLAKRDGFAAALGWGRRWVAWDLRRRGAERGLCAFLLEAGHAELAVPRLERHATRVETETGIAFDAAGRLLWSDHLQQSSVHRVFDESSLLGVYDLASRVARAADLEQRAMEWSARKAALERVLMRRDLSRVAPVPFADVASLDDAARARTLTDPHPEARRLVAAAIAAELGSVDDAALRSFARAAVESQGRPELHWFDDMGRIVEAAWQRGLLAEEDRRRYLLQAVVDTPVHADFRAMHMPAGHDELTVSLAFERRLSPGPTAAVPEREFSTIEIELVEPAVFVDGRSVVPIPVRDTDSPTSFDASRFGVGFGASWQPSPGRHVVDVQARLRISCCGTGGRDPTEVLVPIVTRGAFFWDGVK